MLTNTNLYCVAKVNTVGPYHHLSACFSSTFLPTPTVAPESPMAASFQNGVERAFRTKEDVLRRQDTMHTTIATGDTIYQPVRLWE